MSHFLDKLLHFWSLCCELRYKILRVPCSHWVLLCSHISDGDVVRETRAPSRACWHSCPCPISSEKWTEVSCRGKGAEEGKTSPTESGGKPQQACIPIPHPRCSFPRKRQSFRPALPLIFPFRPQFSSYPNLFSIFELGFTHIKNAACPLLKPQEEGE